MGNYINGIGFGSDLEQKEISASGYPVIEPGYAYVDNTEYYIFANSQTVLLSSGVAPDLGYVVGTPYFVVDSLSDIETILNTTGIDISNTIDFTIGVSGVWNDNGTNYDFMQWGLDGKYLVFDTEEELEIETKLIENSYLILSDLPVGDPYELNVEPVWLSFSNAGVPVRFQAKVTDSNGTLLPNEQIDWWKVYDLEPSGILSSGLISTSQTDGNGHTFVNIIPDSLETDLFIYAEYGDKKSKLHWIQINIPLELPTDVFQFDNNDVIWSSREAMTAAGVDSWGELWVANNDAEYSDIITGNSDYPTRGDWKVGFPEYQRPPMTGASSVDEAEGIWNGEDFDDAYDISATGVLAFMDLQRVAIKGYWGQVMITGADIQNIGLGYDAQCLNPSGTYPIYYKEGGSPTGDQNYWSYGTQFGFEGTWEDVRDEGTSKYDSLYYVLYCPGYVGNDVEYFKSNNFYFRGLAVGTTGGLGAFEQDFTIADLISDAQLQQY